MATRLSVQHVLPDSTYTCFVIPSLFTQAACEELLNPAIKNSFQKANSNYPTYYRNNDRFVVDDETLAGKLFQKVKPYLPATIEINNSIPAENGTWQLKELNTRLRFCKYSANQYFHRHLDGVHYRSETVQSKLTFMIYLNNATEFKGGRTLFFKTKETSEVWASYIPRQGDLIVFDHNVWHEGEVLSEGEKFVLRSDILYSRTTSPLQQEPFAGHLGYIWSLLKFDDNTILSGGRDTSIKAWTIYGEEKLSLKEHKNSILSLEKINADTFISGSRDQHIIVWKNYKAVKKIKIHAALVLSLCRITDNTFASGSGDNTIHMADLNGTVLQTFNGHTNWVWQVIKLDEQTIASASEDHTIKIWDLETGQQIVTFTENAPAISLAFHSATKQLISGNLNGDLTIRSLSDNSSINFKAHNGIIRTIKLLNNNIIATGGEDNKVKLWHFNGQLLAELEHQNFVQSIEQLADNKIISASYDGTIKEWEVSLYHSNHLDTRDGFLFDDDYHNKSLNFHIIDNSDQPAQQSSDMKIILACLINVVALSAFAQTQPVPSGVIHWNELPVTKGDHRESRKLTQGTTPEFDYFEVHATTQEKGAPPRPPHAQKDREELIIVKEGTMKCTVGNQTKIISAGSVILVPPQEMQAFENVGNGPLTYYAFAFRSKKPMDLERSKKAGGVMILNIDSLPFKKTEKGGGRKYFDRSTAMCEYFEMHVTQLDHPGPSHAPHQHPETELILITEGNTSMVIDGKTYTGGPGDLYIMEGGKMHGITNLEDKPCSYFAFKWR